MQGLVLHDRWLSVQWWMSSLCGKFWRRQCTVILLIQVSRRAVDMYTTTQLWHPFNVGDHVGHRSEAIWAPISVAIVLFISWPIRHVIYGNSEPPGHHIIVVLLVGWPFQAYKSLYYQDYPCDLTLPRPKIIILEWCSQSFDPFRPPNNFLFVLVFFRLFF